MSDTGGHDPFYRGEQPQDGVPMQPYVPPSSGGYVPPPGGMPLPPKKKRWPWVVGAVVLFCGLPLGGCVALIGIGFNEIGERNDAIEEVITQYAAASRSGDPATIASFLDGESPCMSNEEFASNVVEGGWDAVDISRISFSDRSGNSTFSSNAGENGVTIDGREGESAALVVAVATANGIDTDVEFALTKPLVTWKICTISAR